MVACPTGGPEVAHQIVNTGSGVLRYLAVSNRTDVEVCEYPDSGKVGVFARAPGASPRRGLHRDADAVDYYDGENTDGPHSPRA